MSTDRGYVIEAVSWVLFALSFVLVFLRIWTRTRIIRSLGWDDALICLAMVCALSGEPSDRFQLLTSQACATLNTVMATVSTHYGTGRHATELSSLQRLESTKYNWLSQGFHVMSTNWGKVAVALFLRRILHKIKGHQAILCTFSVVLTIVNTVCVGTIYGQCSPTQRLWNHDVEGSCWDPHVQKDYAFFQGCKAPLSLWRGCLLKKDVAFSAFSDLALAIYPLFTIAGLQMALKVKLGLGFVLSLGIVLVDLLPLDDRIVLIVA